MEYDMVFEGGGAKGMVFVGALQEVEKRGHTPARLLGASAGAIMAAFLAAGYDAQEMAAALNEKVEDQPVFLGFLETPARLTREQIHNSAIREMLASYNLKFVPDFLEERIDGSIADYIAESALAGRICSFIELGGFYAADNFLEWLESKLSSGVYPLERGSFGKGKPRAFANMNLAEYFEATGADLSLVASDTTDARILVLNHNTAPGCPLKWAVRMSMSFPLLWQEVVWQADWGTYLGKDVTGHTVVDGGMLSNFPIELFLSNRDHILRIMGEKTAGQSNVIGFLIDEGQEVPDAPPVAPVGEPKGSGFDFGRLKTVQRVANLVNTMTQAHDKMVIEAYERFVVHLPAKGYGTIEFGMNDERREALVSAGRKATQEYFDCLPEPPPGTLGIPTPSHDLDLSRTTADRIAERILSVE